MSYPEITLASVNNRVLQELGENAAARHLEGLGCRVLARNWRRRTGELDLVVLDGSTLVFVEVKTRAGDRFDPVLAVGPEKQRRLRLIARSFIALERPRFDGCRFDVISVVPGREGATLRHLESAF